jgi:hypothetical protein
MLLAKTQKNAAAEKPKKDRREEKTKQHLLKMLPNHQPCIVFLLASLQMRETRSARRSIWAPPA